jgi:hypothetical protein
MQNSPQYASIPGRLVPFPETGVSVAFVQMNKKGGPSASLCRGTPVLTRPFYSQSERDAKGTMVARCGTRELVMGGVPLWVSEE